MTTSETTPAVVTPAPRATERTHPASGAESPLLVRVARQLEGDERLDGAVRALAPVARAVDSIPHSAELLHGRSMGHALHPLLTDVPIGAWMSATVLDLVGGEQSDDAARTLTGVGVLAALPTAVTGLAEWAHTEGRDSRVGVVHAAGNSVGLALMSMSWVARGKGHRRKGMLLGLAGMAAVGASGFLGAHLSIARDVGARDRSFTQSLPPAIT